MLEENSSVTLIEAEKEKLDKAIDESLLNLPLDEQQEKIAQNILAAPTARELQEQFDLFNMSQSKKNALRIIKLNSLLDKVEDQAIERFERRPDQISNKELLEYMQVVAGQIDRSQKYIDSLDDKPMIKVNEVNGRKTEVNINVSPELNRESREKVVDAIQVLIKQLNSSEEDSSSAVENTSSEDTIVDAIVSEESESITNDQISDSEGETCINSNEQSFDEFNLLADTDEGEYNK